MTDFWSIYEGLKLGILIIILTIIAIKDIKEYRIPNKLLLIAISIRCILFFVEIIQQKVYIVVLEKIVIALVVFVMGIAVNLITRNSIGLGDIKLFATVALFVDKERICDVIVYSIFVMGIISAIMLITKKKGRKDVVPFAPAILIAVVVTWVRYL
jgi:leader peptidase (prepilin peptidase)/N-methyltransferase